VARRGPGDQRLDRASKPPSLTASMRPARIYRYPYAKRLAVRRGTGFYQALAGVGHPSSYRRSALTCSSRHELLIVFAPVEGTQASLASIFKSIRRQAAWCSNRSCRLRTERLPSFLG
jgi:hypothetical protein